MLVAAFAVSGRTRFWILEVLYLLAPLVLVPLAMTLVEPRIAWMRWQPFAAVAAVGSFLAPQGVVAGALAAGWLSLTLRVAWQGLASWRASSRDAAAAAIAVGMLSLPVGGGWLVLSRLGATPMGFQEPIVLLTAVHFHFAAFVTLLLVGRVGWTPGIDGRVYRAVVVGTIAGTPILAAGITFSRTVELAGTLVLAAALWTFALLGLRHVAPRQPPLARTLLTLSFVSLLPSMALAVLYAWGRVTGYSAVGLGHLAVIHAPFNAIGFSLCGLLGWAASPSPVPLYRKEDKEDS
jgi:hypothetical protein